MKRGKKNSLLLLAGFFFLVISACCQPAVGIFATAADFQDGKLSYSMEKDNCIIKIRNGFRKKTIKIKCGTVITYLSKDSVYGYKDKGGVIHRFYKGVIYTLINPAEEIHLYKVQVPAPTKYESPVIEYFFSRNAASAIYPLTVDNVLRTFSDNKRFSAMVELRYRYDSELIEFDTYHNKYKLNCLLETSKN